MLIVVILAVTVTIVIIPSVAVLIVVAPLTSVFVPFQPPVEVEAYTEEFDATDDGNICPQVLFYQAFNGCNQGVLTEGEGTVQLTSWYQLVYIF
jgi:hypothetical protein